MRIPYPSYPRREFLTRSALVAGGVVLLSACTDGPPKPSPSGGGGLPKVEGGTVVTDPAKVPTKFSESPDFSSLVKAGKLPPVEQRIGRDPLVIKPLNAIGKYGGEIRRGYLGVGEHQNANRFCSGPDSLLYWDFERKNVVPNLAKSFELSDGDKVLTLRLRRGMRWSDGHPFTADDIMFWRDDVSLEPSLSVGSSSLRIQGQPVRVVKVDDYTVQYVSPVPNPLMPQLLAGWTDIGGITQNGPSGGGGYLPKHYLSKFHPKYTPKAELDKLAAAAGVPTWSAHFLRKCDWVNNTALPMLTPWVVTRPIGQSPWTFEANPYSIWVDTEGNQLPYIPKVILREVENQEVLVLRAVAGDYDFQDRGLGLGSLPVLLKNQKGSKYTIHRLPTSDKLDFVVRVNLAYNDDPVIGELLRTTDFRRALSLGIDRKQINETYCLGTSVPTAYMAADDSPYFPGAQWRTKWATHDPAQANELLDKLGLTKRDSSGYRLRPDGKGRIRLGYQANKNFLDLVGAGEMIKRQWHDIGIDMTVSTPQGGLSVQQILANQVVLQGIAGAGTDDPFLKLGGLLPTNDTQGTMGIPYAKWFESGGKQGAEPPASVRGLKDAMSLRDQGLTASLDERIRLAKQMYMMHADQVWSIGVVGFGLSVYGLYLAKNDLGNVPARVLNLEFVRSPVNALPMTFFHR